MFAMRPGLLVRTKNVCALVSAESLSGVSRETLAGQSSSMSRTEARLASSLMVLTGSSALGGTDMSSTPTGLGGAVL